VHSPFISWYGKYVIVSIPLSGVAALLLCASDPERSRVAVYRRIAILHGDCKIPSWAEETYV